MEHEEIKELANPYLHIYTPIEFKLTQIMSSNSSKQIGEDSDLNTAKRDKDQFENMIRKYNSTPLPKSATIGFKNLGNNCYMNSIVQILINHPILYYYFKNLPVKTYEGDTLKFSAFEFVKRLLNVCFGGVNSKGKELKYVRLTSLVKNIDQIGRRFERGKQQDAMMFFRNFMSRL